MQQEFYIGQKVKTSQVGIEKGFYDMEGIIVKEGKWCGNVAYYVKYTTTPSVPDGLWLPEELEPLEDSIPHIVFDSIAKNL